MYATGKTCKPDLRLRGIGRFFNLNNERFCLYSMMVIPIGFFLVFKYIPMFGFVIAFQDYNIFEGIFGSPFVGFENFVEIFRMNDFMQAFKNTFVLSILSILFGFPGPILLALMLNEVRSSAYKRTVQSIVYLPHFLSWVIIGGMVYRIFSEKYGIINNVLDFIGVGRVPFLSDGKWWTFTYLVAVIWQGIGYGSIVYLSAITSINDELYEAAKVDGCGRLRAIWNITLPSIRPTIITMLLLQIGNVLNIGFEKAYALGNSMVTQYSDILSTFVYRIGVQNARFSIATSVGLFQSIVGFVLLTGANYAAKKIGEDGLW